jgi:ketosteroid isomerase-like protein
VKTPEIEVVMAWHAALNAGDVEQLVSLSTPDVELGGPRGSGRGADLLSDWVSRAGVRLEPRQFIRGDGDGALIVEQAAVWQAENGELTQPRTVASLFRVRRGRVASVIRYPDVGSAQAAARKARQL